MLENLIFFSSSFFIVLLMRSTCALSFHSMPACLHQTVCRDPLLGITSGFLHAGSLFGASLFSYRDIELLLGYVSHLVIGCGFERLISKSFLKTGYLLGFQ